MTTVQRHAPALLVTRLGRDAALGWRAVLVACAAHAATCWATSLHEHVRLVACWALLAQRLARIDAWFSLNTAAALRAWRACLQHWTRWLPRDGQGHFGGAPGVERRGAAAGGRARRVQDHVRGRVASKRDQSRPQQPQQPCHTLRGRDAVKMAQRCATVSRTGRLAALCIRAAFRARPARGARRHRGTDAARAVGVGPAARNDTSDLARGRAARRTAGRR